MRKKFDEIFEDCTKLGTKIKTDEYHSNGKHPIIDQGQEMVAGFTDLEDGLFDAVPAIVFGDHTRIIKYVDYPFFLGADGVKVLRSKVPNANYRYLYYALKNAKIPNTGYNRHYKWLKELEIEYPPIDQQIKTVKVLDKVESIIYNRQNQLQKLDELVKARFVELFGNPIANSKKWEEACITALCKKIYGGGTPSKSCPEYFDGTIPWVSPKDMKSTIIVDSQDHITTEAIKNSTTNLIPENAVLMVIRSGILKHTLPVAINSVPVTINQDMKAFVPGERIRTRFLMNYFQAIESDVLRGVRGVTADNIDFKEFQKRMIAIPPIELQDEFEHFVEQVDKSKLQVPSGNALCIRYPIFIEMMSLRGV